MQQQQHLWTPAADTAIGLYKLTMSAAAAQTIEVEWTDSAGVGWNTSNWPLSFCS